LFRNIGEVVIACHDPIEYASILLAKQKEKIRLGAACLRVLNFRADDVRLRVAAGWNKPPRVCRALAGAEQAGMPMDRSAASIADYASELTHAICREGAGLDAVNCNACWMRRNRTWCQCGTCARSSIRRRAGLKRHLPRWVFPAARLRLERQAKRARTVLATYQVFTALKLATLDQAIDHATRRLSAAWLRIDGLRHGIVGRGD